MNFLTIRDQYRKEVAAVSRTCSAKQLVDCRAHLIRLKELTDGEAEDLPGDGLQ